MKNKLNGRDFITIGIFNAIGIVIYMAVAFAMATTVIGGFIASGVSFMVAATVYILMAVIGGIICDLIIGNYESKGRMIIGYGTFALADFLGTVIPVILFGTASFVERASKWKMSEAQINEALSYFKVSWAVGFGLITFVLACIGAFVATMILKKHFEKAGVI